MKSKARSSTVPRLEATLKKEDTKLRKETVIDKIEVLVATGHVQVRSVTRVIEGEEQIGPDSYHRHVLAPGDDLVDEDSKVAAIATAAWAAGSYDSPA